LTFSLNCDIVIIVIEWPLRLSARTIVFQAMKVGATPTGATKKRDILFYIFYFFVQKKERAPPDHPEGGFSPPPILTKLLLVKLNKFKESLSNFSF
jgi:hypothetical protein